MDLDEQMSQAIAAAYLDVKAARLLGFRDGFVGIAARAVSDGVDQQMAYFKAFREGRDHREVVEKICAEEGIEMNELFRKAVDLYVSQKNETAQLSPGGS